MESHCRQSKQATIQAVHMPPPDVAEPRVRFFSPMPTGYQFVPKGDVYITGNVRKRTHAAGATLYAVVDRYGKAIGLRCPTTICHEVSEAAQGSAERRAAAIQSRDAAEERDFKAEVVRLYPRLPSREVPRILTRTLEKRRRRVGRTRTLDLESKVHLAVKAHIRYCHTPYERLLKDGLERGEARQRVIDRVEEVALSWLASEPPVGARWGREGQKGKRPREGIRASNRNSDQRVSNAARRSLVQKELKIKQRKASGDEDGGNEESDSHVLPHHESDLEDSDWALGKCQR